MAETRIDIHATVTISDLVLTDEVFDMLDASEVYTEVVYDRENPYHEYEGEECCEQFNNQITLSFVDYFQHDDNSVSLIYSDSEIMPYEINLDKLNKLHGDELYFDATELWIDKVIEDKVVAFTVLMQENEALFEIEQDCLDTLF